MSYRATVSDADWAKVEAGTHVLAWHLKWNDKILFEVEEGKFKPYVIRGYPNWGLTHGYIEVPAEYLRKDGTPGKNVVLSCRAETLLERVVR